MRCALIHYILMLRVKVTFYICFLKNDEIDRGGGG